jgi:hypothetical protein
MYPVELARRMGVTQAAISRMEQPHDLLLSTLQIVATHDDAHSTITMVGEYADELVKLNGRWLFATRNVTTDGRQ